MITIRKPDDFHVHLRDKDYLYWTTNYVANTFKRALVMPNLFPPLTTCNSVNEYKSRIMSYANNNFTPLMTLYLTSDTTIDEIKKCTESGIIACKLYPMNITTNSSYGISLEHLKSKAMYNIFYEMAKNNIILSIHAEETDHNIDIFDREEMFIKNYLPNIISSIPTLKIVLEHISTQFATEFITNEYMKGNKNIAGTITVQHLFFNKNDLFSDGLQPHLFCLPILKNETDRQALIKAIASGYKCFFAGTDSAPHSSRKKESKCCPAGCFTNHALELYTQIFENHNALDNLESFVSENGAKFYNLELNDEYIILEKNNSITIEDKYMLSCDESVIPLLAGNILKWCIQNKNYNFGIMRGKL